MKWQLRLPNGQSFPVEGQDVVIGSSSRSDVVLPDAEPKHALLRMVAGRWFLESVDDAPLWINERPGSKAFLNLDDKFRLSDGGQTLVFETVKPAPVAPAPQPVATPRTTPPPLLRPPIETERPASRPILQSGPLPTKKRPSGATLIAGASLIVVILAVGLWWLAPRSKTADSVASTDNSSSAKKHDGSKDVGETSHQASIASHEPAAARSGPITDTPIADPLDFLVLVGVASTNPKVGEPAVTGVGWLSNSRTVNIPRELGSLLELVMQELQAKGDRSQYLCVIQSQRIRVDKIQHPASCPKISQMTLASAADLPQAIKIDPMTSAEFEKRRRREHFQYCSYMQLPRSKGAKPPLIGPFDSENVHLRKGTPTIIYEQPIHALKTAVFADDTGRHELERGGLIADSHNHIVGVCLPDSTIVWGSELAPLLTP